MTVTMDFRVGGSYRNVMKIGEGEVVSFGVYIEIDEPNRLAYTLNWEPVGEMAGAPESTVAVDFVERGDATEVRLTHSGLASDMMRENVNQGWSAAIEKLGGYLKG